MPGSDGFTAFHTGKDFRGTLGLSEVTLFLDRDRNIVGLSFKYQGRVGYTPIDIGVLVPALRRYGLPVPGWPDPRIGIGGVQPVDYTLDPRFCIMRLQCNFKIGPFLDQLQALVTRHKAPSAWVCMDYLIRHDGQAGIRFWASELPTIYHYVNWDKIPCEHDMMGIGGDGIDRFIEAGACKMAPGDLWCEWPSGFQWSHAEADALKALGRPGVTK